MSDDKGQRGEADRWGSAEAEVADGAGGKAAEHETAKAGFAVVAGVRPKTCCS